MYYNHGEGGFVGISEKLTIKNFFTIENFDWEIKGFNILTGGMGSGKSLAIKLLYFCEQIFHKTIFSESNLNKEKLSKEKYFNTVEEHFYQLFPSKNKEKDFANLIIKYEYVFYSGFDSVPELFDQPNYMKFDLSAEWSKETKKLTWSSSYISGRLEKWQTFFNAEKTPDLLDNIKNSIYGLILADFQNSFPIASMFIPASRAIIAMTDAFSSRDQFINSFLRLKNFALSFDKISSEVVNNILQINNITINENNEPIFELKDGRIITSLELSSGQQELLYLLLLINHLDETIFRYGESVSVFIEEPCAHLFPKEQKETMEFIVFYFSSLQKNKENEPGHRFFISTHSPYILNTINNIIEKCRLINNTNKINDKKVKNEILEKLNNFEFPDLPIDNVSAYMICDDRNVHSMINSEEEEKYIYSDVINHISEVIQSDSENLITIDGSIKDYLKNKAGSI